MVMGVISAALLLAASALGIAGYAIYLRDLSVSSIRPNKWSWLIWSVAAALEASTYDALNADLMKSAVFYLSAVACLFVTATVWRRSGWTAPDWTEAICATASVGALLLWLLFSMTWWAHILMVASVPIAFIPTWRDALADKTREASSAWGLWTMGDACALAIILLRLDDPGRELPYILVELACHGSVWLLERRRRAPTGFVIKRTQLGKAVFADRAFRQGEVLVPFLGPTIHRSTLPVAIDGECDRFVQIAPEHYLGPSGGIDDFVNHSCEPNAGLRFSATDIQLVAIKDIAKGDEIAWDYSTTSLDASRRMTCRCGAPSCRKSIAGFGSLPAGLQAKYCRLGIVPKYVVDRTRPEMAGTGATSESHKDLAAAGRPTAAVVAEVEEPSATSRVAAMGGLHVGD